MDRSDKDGQGVIIGVGSRSKAGWGASVVYMMVGSRPTVEALFPREDSLLVYLKAFVLAVVEGATEFLPVSSTGHLILVEAFITLSDDVAFNAAFMVMIQLPAVLSVALYFRGDLFAWGRPAEERAGLGKLWTKIFIAFAPVVVVGPFVNDFLEARLFAPVPVAVALLVGGIILIVIEYRERRPVFEKVSDIPYGVAFVIGLVQCVSMIPGTSRSAATIVGAMLLGASRPAAAEFSFFLAIPTMLGAFVFKMIQGGVSFTGEQWAILGVGSVVSFAVAYAVIAAFMAYVRRHSFIVFGYYRIALAVCVLGLLLLGYL